MQILITGGSGLLMSRVIDLLGNSYSFVSAEQAIPVTPQNAVFVPLDITDSRSVYTVVKTQKPEVIIHAAALTNPEQCEKDHESARLINIEGTKNMAEAAAEIGAYLIYISTDFVFKGDRGNYYETDSPDPVNYYGQTKREGEMAVQKLTENACIARITFPYRARFPQKMDCIRWMWEKMGRGEPITAVSDQVATPTFVDDIASALGAIVQKRPQGIYHIAGSSRQSWYEAAKTVADIFGYDQSLITPITYEQFINGKERAPRPSDSSLSADKINRELGIALSDLRQGLTQIKTQMREMV